MVHFSFNIYLSLIINGIPRSEGLKTQGRESKPVTLWSLVDNVEICIETKAVFFIVKNYAKNIISNTPLISMSMPILSIQELSFWFV